MNRSYMTYRTYVEESSPEIAANTLVCLIHQANYLLDQQLRQLEQAFLSEGGFTERLYRSRQDAINRTAKSPRPDRMIDTTAPPPSDR